MRRYPLESCVTQASGFEKPNHRRGSRATSKTTQNPRGIPSILDFPQRQKRRSPCPIDHNDFLIEKSRSALSLDMPRDGSIIRWRLRLPPQDLERDESTRRRHFPRVLERPRHPAQARGVPLPRPPGALAKNFLLVTEAKRNQETTKREANPPASPPNE